MCKLTGYFNYNMCTICGGVCCCICAGIIYPEQVLDEKGKCADKVFQLLKTGKYVLDCWDGDPLHVYQDIYYLRPAHIRGDKIVDRSWGGICVMLKPDGCACLKILDLYSV